MFFKKEQRMMEEDLSVDMTEQGLNLDTQVLKNLNNRLLPLMADLNPSNRQY